MDPKTAIKQLKLLKKKGSIMRLAAEKWKNKFETLISIMLSARSRDETTIIYAAKLFEKYPTAEKLSKAKLEAVQQIIRPINFYRNKSRNVIACSKMLVEKHNSIVPMELEELIELPGVGRKTANVFLSEQGKQTIGVDTHLSYISRKLQWTKNKNPNKIEIDLQKLFPKRYWSKINPITVRFGKTYTSRTKKDRILNMINEVK